MLQPLQYSTAAKAAAAAAAAGLLAARESSQPAFLLSFGHIFLSGCIQDGAQKSAGQAPRPLAPPVGCRRETLTSLGPLAAVKTACECTEPESASAEPRLSESQPSPARRKVKGVSLVLRGTRTPPTLSGSLRGAQTDMRLGVPLGYSNGHSSPTSHTPGLGWESPTSSTPYWP